MALVKYSALIQNLQGAIGGTVFQEGPAGPIAKKKCPPVRRNTLRQQKPRLIATQVQQGWALLTEDERDTWEGWATYMKVHQRRNTGLFINGHQNYLRVNQYRLQYSLTLLNVPQFNKCDLTPVDATLRLAGPNLFIDFDRPTVGTEEFVILFITIPVKITWNNPQGRLKLIEFVTTNAITKNITADYETVYGFSPSSGDTLFFKFSNMDKRSGLLFPFKTKKVTL